MTTDKAISQAQRATALSINHMLNGSNVDKLTQFELQEISELAEDIGRVLPAGNVVKMVFSQLRSARGRRLDQNDSKRMMALLQQGMATMLDRASYVAFYTTPALLISGYQMLLKAAGRDPSESFPYGVWQFYLEFGLREDSGRHACETVGFQQNLSLLGGNVTEGDQLAANLLAAADLLLIYEQFLATEWRERLLLTRLGDMLNDPEMVHKWLARRPYDVPVADRGGYIQYRQAQFGQFVREQLQTQNQGENPNAQQVGLDQYGGDQTLNDEDRRAYQQQMTLLATLFPSTYSDERQLIDYREASVGVVWQGRYYLVPLVFEGERLSAEQLRHVAHGIIQDVSKPGKPQIDEWLVHIPRAAQQNARAALPRPLRTEIEQLGQAPIIINWDASDATQYLAVIRQGQRGVGDHPLTVFRTRHSLVFDQSHIFFDATLGMAVAEIYTNFASRRLRQIRQLGRNNAAVRVQAMRLELAAPSDVDQILGRYLSPTFEVAAETTSHIVGDMNRLRKLFKQRSDALHITVNDLLLLYRSAYNQIYVPSEQLRQHLQQVASQQPATKALVNSATAMLERIPRTIPAILIPIDASAYNPGARLFPITFCPREPWTEVYGQHQYTWQLLQAYQKTPDVSTWENFSQARVYYLQMVRMFGVLMQRYKDIALEGKSFSTFTLQMLAGVPRSVQEMLRDIPDRVDILNDMLKGTEVFSNVGRVASTSTLWRFITAKDDNHKKELCWGIMTRADNTMVVSLRDFRPAVLQLLQADAPGLAQHITEDFLNGYVRGLEQFIWQLNEITRTRRRH